MLRCIGHVKQLPKTLWMLGFNIRFNQQRFRPPVPPKCPLSPGQTLKGWMQGRMWPWGRGECDPRPVHSQPFSIRPWRPSRRSTPAALATHRIPTRSPPTRVWPGATWQPMEIPREWRPLGYAEILMGEGWESGIKWTCFEVLGAWWNSMLGWIDFFWGSVRFLYLCGAVEDTCRMKLWPSTGRRSMQNERLKLHLVVDCTSI